MNGEMGNHSAPTLPPSASTMDGADDEEDFRVEYWLLSIYFDLYLAMAICCFSGLFCWIFAMICSGLAREFYRAMKRWEMRMHMSHARQLQGQFGATRCPICLEDFQQPRTAAAAAAAARAAIADDDDDPQTKTERTPLLKPSALLSAGGAASTTKKVRFSIPVAEEAAPAATITPPAGDSSTQILGSDGLPLKLLHCGHVLDQTCWDDLPSRQKSSCPICRHSLSV